MKEIERNKALILLAQDFVKNNDIQKIELLKILISNDTDAIKFSFKIITGINLLDGDNYGN